LKRRTPLLKPEWMANIIKMTEHEHSPKWNTLCGDRLVESDIGFIKSFEESLYTERTSLKKDPGEKLYAWIKELERTTLWFSEKLANIDITRDFTCIPFMERKNLAANLDLIVPYKEDLSRLVVNPTSGTTGEPISAPNHPKSVGCYDPMISYALRCYGVNEKFDHTMIAAIQLCAQKHTITYNTVHSYLDGAGFAKINLASSEWLSKKSSGIFISGMAPVFLSGDPYSYVIAKNIGITYKPKAILSTALELPSGLKKELQEYFGCPVIDFYSSNETGPIAYGCPDHDGVFHILPADIFIETVDEYGEAAEEGQSGEIVFTGGRNPYLPLLRYKTGDRGILDFSPCTCGEVSPKLKLVSGRRLVIFRDEENNPVNPIDISRILKDYPVYMHRMIQKKNRDCILSLFVPDIFTTMMEHEVIKKMNVLFGKDIRISLKRGMDNTEEKSAPYINESE
jgi:phenylacetate-CoA ligase